MNQEASRNTARKPHSFQHEVAHLCQILINRRNIDIIRDRLSWQHSFSHPASYSLISFMVFCLYEIKRCWHRYFIEFPIKQVFIEFLRTFKIICWQVKMDYCWPVSYTHLRAHE